MSDWPFGNLAPMSFDVVLADPPWRFNLRSEKGEGKSPQAHYACMSLDDIKRLPVSQLCRGDALCFMWTTWPMIASATDDAADCIRNADRMSVPAAHQVMRSWGFAPVTGGAWFKRTKNDANWTGTGYVMRSACEPFLIGRMGSPLLKAQRGAFETEIDDGIAVRAAIREHSRKPDLVYALIEKLCPRAMRGIELFARQRWTASDAIAWDAWGNEAEKFQAVA